MLVTGSQDFSIILWNINTGEMVHRFVVQTGEILQLSVPPNTVNVNMNFLIFTEWIYDVHRKYKNF